MADLSFTHYYQTELAYYRELAQEFAQAYPEVAHLIAERGADPAADRLLEGAALLTARLRRRIEDDSPEIVHPTFERLWPQFLRPLPAVTLLRFSPLPNALRRTQTIAAGTMVKSGELETGPGVSDRVACSFRTTAAVDLHPLVLTRAELGRPHPADLQLRLGFRLTAGAVLDDLRMTTLRFQLLGDEVGRYSLYSALVHAERVSVVGPGGATCLTLAASHLRSVGLSPAEALYPGRPTPLPGLQLVRDYFRFPDKFLAVELGGLDQLQKGRLSEAFELVFHLGRQPESALRVDAEALGLGCVPAVNLSPSTKLDVRVRPGIFKYRLDAPHGGQIFEVERVLAYDAGSSEWREVRPFEAAGPAEERGQRYQVLRRAEGVEGLQSYLLITDQAGRPCPPQTDVLQVWLTHTDGALPLQLAPGSVDRPTPSSPEFATFENLTAVRPGEQTRLDRDSLWRALALLCMHPRDLCTVKGLQLLLREAEGEGAASHAPELLEVRLEMGSRLYRRTVVPLRRITVVVNDRSFLCPGQLQLFARVLSTVFRRPEGSLVFSHLTVRGEPSGVEHQIEPD